MRSPHDDQTRLISALKSLGLTKYEALVYIALMKVDSATASGIHEISGVPRASVYPVLEQLQEKNVVSVSQSSPKRFAAAPPGKGVATLLGQIEGDATYAGDALTRIYHERITAGKLSEELIWNVYGLENISRRLIDLIAGAKEEVRIIAHPRIFSGEIRQILTDVSEHASVEVITSQWEGKIPGSMEVYVKRHPDLPQEFNKGMDMLAGGVCIIDKRTVMVVVGSGDEDAVALFSESEGFVRFFTRYYSLIVDWAKNPDKRD